MVFVGGCLGASVFGGCGGAGQSGPPGDGRPDAGPGDTWATGGLCSYLPSNFDLSPFDFDGVGDVVLPQDQTIETDLGGLLGGTANPPIRRSRGRAAQPYLFTK